MTTTATINRDADASKGRFRLDLIHDDGDYRWIGEDGADSEVSGATEAEAIEAAKTAWRSDCGADWDFRVFATGKRVIGGTGEDREAGTVAEPTATDLQNPMATRDNVMVLWDSGVATWTPIADLENE